MDITTLVNITSRSWCLTILKLMNEGTAGRQAPLLAQSGASRTSFAHSMSHLVALNLIERNPGHGHPPRPEFRLTVSGHKYAQLAKMIADTFPETHTPALLRRAWSIPILAASHAPRRFVEIKGQLPAITDRALSQSLQKLETQQWMARRIDETSHPVRPYYQAINEGRDISNAVSQLI
jgi:DNA-binding HxlR family transcriptional regulator